MMNEHQRRLQFQVLQGIKDNKDAASLTAVVYNHEGEGEVIGDTCPFELALALHRCDYAIDVFSEKAGGNINVALDFSRVEILVI